MSDLKANSILQKSDRQSLDEVSRTMDDIERDNDIYGTYLLSPSERLVNLLRLLEKNEPDRHRKKKQQLHERILVLEQERIKLARENNALRKRLAAIEDTSSGDTIEAISALVEQWTRSRLSTAMRLKTDDLIEKHHNTARVSPDDEVLGPGAFAMIDRTIESEANSHAAVLESEADNG